LAGFLIPERKTTMIAKPTKNETSASRHPANVARLLRERKDSDDGFSPTGHVAQQRKKVWNERDNPERDKS
jgi:hypothetical protein